MSTNEKNNTYDDEFDKYTADIKSLQTRNDLLTNDLKTLNEINANIKKIEKYKTNSNTDTDSSYSYDIQQISSDIDSITKEIQHNNDMIIDLEKRLDKIMVDETYTAFMDDILSKLRY
jgi:predicted RNase H-like nuclease (RuvC/YqgF family)